MKNKQTQTNDASLGTPKTKFLLVFADGSIKTIVDSTNTVTFLDDYKNAVTAYRITSPHSIFMVKNVSKKSFEEVIKQLITKAATA